MILATIRAWLRPWRLGRALAAVERAELMRGASIGLHSSWCAAETGLWIGRVRKPGDSGPGEAKTSYDLEGVVTWISRQASGAAAAAGGNDMATRARIEVFEAVNGEWRYRVRARNNEILVQSESYRDATDAKRGALAMCRAVAIATIEVLSC